MSREEQQRLRTWNPWFSYTQTYRSMNDRIKETATNQPQIGLPTPLQIDEMDPTVTRNKSSSMKV